jgi:hypothetical protein
LEMSSFLFKAVILASSVGLVLPQGWCCATLTRPQAAAGRPKAACCQRSCCRRPEVRPTNDCGGTPARPSVRCCCQRDAALPVKRVQQSVVAPLIVPVVICNLGVGPATSVGWRLLLVPHSGSPPPHLLQCVWRC